MENKPNLFESILESAADYGQTSYDLVKLKVLDKTADVVSSIMTQYITFVLLIFFFLFTSLGLSFWLGELLGKIYYGFFVVAGFYGFTGTIYYLTLYRKVKRLIGDYTIRKVLK